jgi:SET domain-containing protein
MFADRRIGRVMKSYRKKQISRVMPHTGVYTRIGVSTIHGVGVIAICNIRKGARIFGADNDVPLVEVPEEQVKRLPAEIQKLYDDFCPVKVKRSGRIYVCPKSFNSMTVSWYLNHSAKDPNVRCDKNYDFFAIRAIRPGEELTVDYRTYGESPAPFEDSDV